MDPEQTSEEEVTTDEHETNTDSESEVEEGDAETGDSDRTYTQAEVDALGKERDKRWKDRIKKSKKDGDDSKEDVKEVDERWLRTDLKADGIKDKKEQDIIIEYISQRKSKGEDVTVEQAQSSMVVREDIAALRAKNVPAPSTRTGTGATDSFEYYAKNIKAGKMRLSDVTDAGMRQRLMSGKIFT